MSLSGLLRAAWLAIPAAVFGGSALAQQIITVPPGMVVVLTPGPALQTARAPVLVETRNTTPVSPIAVERMFAQQQALMDRMMADMNAMFSLPGPNGLMRAMFGGATHATPALVPAAGGAFCEESVSVSYNGGAAAPVVKVSHAGNACGEASGAAPVPAEVAPSPAVPRPTVIQINEPAPLTSSPVRHRT